jgi:excisionase family DNA binding protein
MVMLSMTGESTEYLTPREVAEQLHVTQGTVVRWVRLGLVEGIRLPGGQYRIPKSEIERLKRTPPT